MVLTGKLVYYNDKNERMIDAIETNEVLTRSQKVVQMQAFKEVTITADTTGIYVDQTGEPVELVPIDTGAEHITEFQVPEGTIPELQFWQQLPLSYFLANSGLAAEILTVLEQIPFSTLFYGAIQQSMLNLDARKRF